MIILYFTESNDNTTKGSQSGCVKSTQKTQTTLIFANKICKVEYYLQNSNLIRLR